MKVRYLICLHLFLLISIFTYAQPAPMIINERVDVNMKAVDAGLKTYPWNNGIIYLGFCLDSLFFKRGITLAYYDLSGQQIWARKFYDANNHIIQGNEIISINNSSFYVTGIIGNYGQFRWDSFVAKFDQYGDSIFVKRESDTTSIYPVDLCVYSSDTLIQLTLIKDSTSSDSSMMRISILDSSANIINEVTSGLTKKEPFQILRYADKILIGGIDWYPPNPLPPVYNGYGHSKVFIDVYDLQLNKLAIWNPGSTLNEIFTSLNIWNNKLLLTSIVTNNPNWHTYGCQIMVGYLDTAGHYTMTKNIGRIYDSANLSNYVKSHSVVLNNNCVVVPFNYDNDSIFILIDPYLDTLCVTSVTYENGYEFLYDISPVNGDRISGVGDMYPDSVSTQDHWIFQTDALYDFQNGSCFYNGINKIQETENIKVYPNPVVADITIDRFSETGPAKLYIFDMLGNAVYKTLFFGKQFSFNPGLTTGIYLLTINTGKDRWQQKIVVY